MKTCVKLLVLIVLLVVMVVWTPTALRFFYGAMLAQADYNVGPGLLVVLAQTRVSKMHQSSVRGYEFYIKYFTDKYPAVCELRTKWNAPIKKEREPDNGGSQELK